MQYQRCAILPDLEAVARRNRRVWYELKALGSRAAPLVSFNPLFDGPNAQLSSLPMS